MIKRAQAGRNPVALSAPWVAYYHSLQALFDADPDIEMDYNEDEYKVTMRITGDKKYQALTALIPAQKTFGDVTLNIVLIPANQAMTVAQLFDAAFDDNPNYSFTQVVQSPLMSNPMTFVVFKKEVAQFFNDNLGDLYGNRNTLYENIAREVLIDHDGVFFCTDKE